MIPRTRPDRGRRLAAPGWSLCLLTVAVATLAGGSGDPAPVPEPLPAPAFHDTTGQAALRWQVTRPGRRASLYQADRTVYRTVDGEDVSYHYGNVYIDRDTVVVRADSAHVFESRDLVRLFDHVRLRHFDTLVSCDRADYRRGPGVADLYGSVRVLDEGVLATADRGEIRDDMQLTRLFGNAVAITPDYTVLADTLLRDRRRDHGEAFGRVRITDPDAGSLVTGDHATFAGDGSWAEVDRNPVMETRDGKSAPVVSQAGVMTFYRSEERVVMVDSVRIRQGFLRATADTAISYGKDRMVLRGSPVLEQGTRSRMAGREIEFYYRRGALDRVILVGAARMEDTEPDSLAAIYRGLPALDVIEGDSITVRLLAGEIQRTDVVGRAHSIYVPVDVRDEVAFNDVAGDTLVLHFREQKVREVDVRGNMKGTYRFARIAAMRGPAPADSLAAAADTLVAAADTPAVMAAASDTLATVAADTFSFTDHVEEVRYSGHSVLFDLVKSTIDISEDARLEYDTMVLTAHDVILDTETRELYADGDPLLEDREVIAGRQMGYDFANKTGAVRGGVTDMDGFYYVGEAIQRYPDGSLKICSGKMTSCDKPEPHFHFWAQKMKMRLGDKVVAAPIVLKIGRVPVFALPFYFKSLKEGRRSGILFPNFNFGWSSAEGRYIRDFGYFWATSQYTDFTLRMDYNERRELTWSLLNRYRKRYSFDGNVQYSARRSIGQAVQEKEWQLRWNHTQPNLMDDYNFRANVEMASRTLSRDDLNDDTGQDVIDGSLKSSLSVSRTLGFGGLSLSANRTEYTNAADDDNATDNRIYAMTLPSLSLSVKKITLGRALGPGEEGSLLGSVARATDLSQSYNATATRNATEETVTRQYNVKGNWGLTLRPDRFWIFNPSLSARSTWAWDRFERTGRDWADSLWVNDDLTEENTAPTLTFSSGVTTKLYGVFPVGLGALQTLRHTLSLNASANYRPQLGDKQDRGQSYSFGVGNKFDVKYLSRSADDTVATVKKLDNILAWDLSTSYNPDSDRSWGNVSSSLNIRPGQSRNLNFRMQNTVDPYNWSLLSTTFNYSFGVDGTFDTGFVGQVREEQQNAAIKRLAAANPDTMAADSLAANDQWNEFGDDGEALPEDDLLQPPAVTGTGPDARDDTAGGRFLPWSLSGNLSLNDSKGSDLTSRGSLRVTAKLTRDWSFNYTASFDFRSGRTVRQEYRLQRDLHCWRVEFMRTVSESNSEFAFRLHLLSIPELKLTQGKDNLLGAARGAGAGLGMSGF
ncbi:MAG: putative LPS assembly protein LptD [Candidatus Krumholzibacteriia bacterium]